MSSSDCPVSWLRRLKISDAKLTVGGFPLSIGDVDRSNYISDSLFGTFSFIVTDSANESQSCLFQLHSICSKYLVSWEVRARH